MHETYQTVCPHCHTPTRAPAPMPAQAVKCASCGGSIFDGHPIELTGATFEAHITGNAIPVVVDFWAEWCAPCKIIAPAFAQAAAELEPRVRFAKVDTDEEQKLAGHNGIRGFPTLVIYKGGHEVARHAGAMSAGQIKAWVQTFI